MSLASRELSQWRIKWIHSWIKTRWFLSLVSQVLIRVHRLDSGPKNTESSRVQVYGYTVKHLNYERLGTEKSKFIKKIVRNSHIKVYFKIVLFQRRLDKVGLIYKLVRLNTPTYLIKFIVTCLNKRKFSVNFGEKSILNK